MCKVSVIVPVYNIKQYLPKCIDSIRDQTMKYIEIISVDDGSTDGSAEMCDQYASKDLRIRVLHKENEGLSAARNDGIQMARADCIMFVDGDDWVEPDFCELPYQAAIDHNVEVVCFQYATIFKSGKRSESNPQIEGYIERDTIPPFEQVSAWSKLYHRKLFNDILFPVGRVYEDIATTHRLLHSANGIYVLNQALYNYRKYRPNSITGSATPKFNRDHSWALFSRLQDYESWGMNVSRERTNAALDLLTKYGRKTELSSCWIAILNENRHLPKHSTWKQKMILRIYRVSPLLFDIICIVSIKRAVQEE